jgi:hypothetical protein
MVIKTAATILMKATFIRINHFPRREIRLQAMENHDTFFKVLGKAPMSDTINPTTPKTMEQVPWLVKVFIITEKVRM